MLIPGNDGNLDSPESRIPHKTPKRILHFSDGTLEEYSTDDESDNEDNQVHNSLPQDPSSMTWGPWMYYQTVSAGCKALAACDYMGEALANFFGILSSRYQYEIEEFERIAAEEQEAKKNEVEMSGWTDQAQKNNSALHQQPTKIIV